MQYRFDFILGICWLISLNQDVSLWFKVIGILRLITFLNHLSQLEQTTEIREYIGSYLDLVKLGGLIFLCAHLTGCCWFALAKYETLIGVNATWLEKDLVNFEETETNIDSTVQGYIASFYWAIITMCTVGYGDIGPTTYRERVFVVFICLLASFLFAFSMNSIGEIIKNLRSNNEEFKQQIASINIYMKKRKLTKNLQMRVRKYYEYLFAEKKQENELGTKLIDDLAPALKDDVQKEIYTNIFKKQKLFRLNFSEKLITSLYKYVKEKKYSVDEYLYKEQERAEQLFFILQGEVEIILQGRIILQTLSQGEFVGSQEFFGDNPYQFSAKVNTFTQFLIIEKKDFIEHLSKLKTDYESFQQIKDNINHQGSTSALCTQCESCGQYGHTFLRCQMIQFHGNKYKQIYNYNSIKQARSKEKVKRRDFTFATIECVREVEESVKGFHEHIYYTQLLNEENDKKDLKNFSTIDDDEYNDSNSETEKTEQNLQEERNEELEQKQIEAQDVESRNQVVNLQNSEDQSFCQESKNNSQALMNQSASLNQSLNKKQKGNSLFAREFIEKAKSPQSSEEDDEDDESEIYNINNPISPENNNNSAKKEKKEQRVPELTIQAPKIQDSPSRRLQQASSRKGTANKMDNNKQLSCFFQYAMKDIEQNGKNHNNQLEDQIKETPKTKQNIHIEEFIQQGSQKNIAAILKTKLFTKKNEELRRKSRYISGAQLQGLHKQVSIQLSESQNNSPPKKIPQIPGFPSILSPKNNPLSPHMGNQPHSIQRIPTFTPKQGDRRGTIRNATQFSNSINSLVYNMFENAIEQEDRIQKKPSINQEVESDFDIMKEFEVYFTRNNPSNVINSYNNFVKQNKCCQDFLKEKSLRRKKKGATQKTKYERKNYSLLHKKNPQTLKHQQASNPLSRGNTVANKKISVDWTKQCEIEMEKPLELNKQEIDALINNE